VGTTDPPGRDLYRLLGVRRTAADAEITRAYRRLARRLHPDAGGHAGGVRFGAVAAAYRVLHDPERRREYDEELAAEAARPDHSTGGRGQSHGPALPANRRAAGPGSPRIDDRRSAFAERRPGRIPRPRRGTDLETDLRLPFEDAVRGTSRRLRLPSGTVTVRIPAGVADRQVIRLAGYGGPGEHGGLPGDLRIRLHVARHRFFTRKGSDLLVTVPVTFAEAALGAAIRIPALDRPARLRLPPGTATGTTFRLRGRGVTVSGDTGDLLVTVQVDVPRRLDDRQRAAIEALAAATPRSPRLHLWT
jgi:molecular chaperone DnaJ